MPESQDTPQEPPEEPKKGSVMDRLRTLSTKPAQTFDRLKRLRTASKTDPLGALEELTEEEDPIITPENFIEPSIIDPETEYQSALEEIRTDNKDQIDPFNVFKQFTKPDRNTSPERPTRRFTAIDKARHKLLGIQAHRQGIANIEEFNRLVECLETDLDGFREDDTCNISSDNIPVIKALLDTGVDAVSVIRALKSNAYLYRGLLDPENLKYESDTAALLKLLKAPNVQELLPLIQGMTYLPHSKWEFRSSTHTQSPISTLISLAEHGTIPNYPPEFFERVGIIARALDVTVQIEDLPAYESLINNPNKLHFLAFTMKSGNFDECFSRWGALSPVESVFDVLNSLETNGLIVPLTTLMQSGISLNSRNDDVDRSDYGKRSQDQIIQDLLGLVAKSETQDILINKERQEFAQILRKMTGRPMAPTEITELFEYRQDLIALNNMIFGSLDAKFVGDYSTGDKLKALTTLLTGKEGRQQILLSPDFQQFIIDLQQSGIVLEHKDFFRYERDVLDNKDHPEGQNVLIQLYQCKELTSILNPDMPKSIIEGIRDKYGSEKYEIAMADMQRLREFGRNIETFKLLQNAGIPIPQEKLESVDWITQIKTMPLLSYGILKRIPPDQKNEWVKKAIQLPYYIQWGLQKSFADEWQKTGEPPPLNPEGINRVDKLVKLVSSTAYLQRAYLEHHAGIQELYSTLGLLKGGVSGLFTDGQPNIEFATLLIDSGKFNALALILSDDLIATLPKNEQEFWTVIQSHPTISNHILDNRSLFDSHGIPMPEFLYKFAGSDNWHLVNKLLTDEVLETYTPDEKRFWTTIKKHPFICGFLSKHRDNFEQYFVGEIPTVALCNQVEKTHAAAIADMLTDKVLATFPEGEREFWTTVKNHRELAEELVTFREEIDAQGRITPAFCYRINSQSDGSKIIELLTDDILEAFPPEEKAFWTEVKKYKSVGKLVNIVKTGKLTRERLTKVLQENGDSMNTSFFLTIALNSPEIVLKTDEGINFVRNMYENGTDTLDSQHDSFIGQQLIEMKRLNHNFDGLFTKLFSQDLARTDNEVKNADTLIISEDNWQSLLMAYLRNQADVDNLPPISDESAAKLNALFEDPKTRDLCLSSLRVNWLAYLQNGEPDQMPFSLQYLTEYIKMCDGAGPLSQLESLSTFINSFQEVLNQPPKASLEKTRRDMLQGTAAMEARFVKERWSNEDKTDFYNISADILQAEPRIFSDYLELFQKLSPSDLKRFTREIYPLYRAKLALIEKVGRSDTKTFDMLHLIYLKRDIKNFGRGLATEEHPFETQRAKLTAEIMGLFKDRFGIIKVPETFTAEHMRSLTNASMYLANLNGRNATRETILGYYLALSINDRWDSFRKGEVIDPTEFVTLRKAAEIQAILEQRKEVSPLTAENLGISEEELSEFMALLQQESQNMMIGDVETIDIKLNNVIINLHSLEDTDLYPEVLDKQRLQLALSFGSKRIGSTAAKMYLSLKDPGKTVQLTPEELEVRDEIIKIAQANGLELTAENIKTHFQDGMKPFSTIASILQFVRESEAEPSIKKLRETLRPSQEVIDIFTRLGEDFKPTSGALAISQDLNSLDNLIVKREDELTPAERELLVRYVGVIREQVIQLETIHDQIKNKFSGMKQGNLTTDNPLLRDKLDQIDKIINSNSTQQSVTATMTSNLNVIIENMRECLSCTRQGANNDTNLTFGDSNKFYLYTQSEAQVKGSISDEIVFFEPIIHEDGKTEMAFVFDRVYGTNTPLILTNHVETVLKKYRGLKKKFPQSKLSIFVTDSAMKSAGLSDVLFTQTLRELLGAQATINDEQVEVDVVGSAFADHYVEFGGDTRTPGKRNVMGISIRI